MGLLELIDRWSTLRNLILMIVASFVVVMVMAMLTQTWVYDVYGEVTMPDTRFSYSFNEITDVFNTLGPEGLIVWAQAHMLDFLFPLTYMFAMAFGLNMEIRKLYPENVNIKKLVLIPLLGGIADYVENILVLTQIAVFPNLSESVILIASVITSLKWILLVIGFVTIFVLLPLIIYHRLFNAKTKTLQ
ncbi:MAG: hypothetical protein ACFFCX_03030 [Candidatus Sifarchaeia archaeon]